jgi:hypothetical protein
MSDIISLTVFMAGWMIMILGPAAFLATAVFAFFGGSYSLGTFCILGCIPCWIVGASLIVWSERINRF